jgi:cell wall-associated NlpC family hydrolase
MNQDPVQWCVYLMQFIGLPYIWGGKNVNKDRGLDCSGLVENALQYFRLNPPLEMNAAQMCKFYSDWAKASCAPQFGALAFFGKDADSIEHVAICLNETQMLEAAHGDHTCVNPTIAAQRGAKVQVDSIARRKDLFTVVMPPYPFLKP